MSRNSAHILEHLQNGDISIEGQLVWGSNYTLLSTVKQDGHTLKAVYKPVDGERPLSDFPSDSLAGREVAAYWVSQSIGWDFVPPTIFREDAPSGPGSLQLFIEHNPAYHYFNFNKDDRSRLPRVALFDALVNNTDRKGGHIIIDPDNKLWLIDHGICFHAVPKLRTVIWDFTGEPISEQDCIDLQAFGLLLEPGSILMEQLTGHLTPREIQALRDRNDKMLANGRFPTPIDKQRSLPWPPV